MLATTKNSTFAPPVPRAKTHAATKMDEHVNDTCFSTSSTEQYKDVVGTSRRVVDEQKLDTIEQ